jgi:hypothetical protein
MSLFSCIPLCSTLTSRLSLLHCDTPSAPVDRAIFGLTPPSKLGGHCIVASAPRSMHELHWLPLARAYVLTILCDREQATEFEWTSASVPKSFVFSFAQSKDAKHVINGFCRSLNWAGVDAGVAEEVVSVLRGVDVQKGDELVMVCDPDRGHVLVWLMRNGVTLRETRVSEGDVLIGGLHRLFLTDNKYKHMFGRLCKSAKLFEWPTVERCKQYVNSTHHDSGKR